MADGKDERIRYRPAERAALLVHGVRAFCLTSGDMRAATMAATYVSALPAIVQACSERGAFLYAVSPTGLRRVDLSN